MSLRSHALALVAAAQLVGCGNDAMSPPVSIVAPAGADASDPLSLVSGGPAMNSAPRAAIEAALADAARRTGRPVSALRVVEAMSVTWPDGSLGCAEPGVVYTMAPVRGFRIRIQADAEVLAYHGREGAAPFYCPPGRGGGSSPAGTT